MPQVALAGFRGRCLRNGSGNLTARIANRLSLAFLGYLVMMPSIHASRVVAIASSLVLRFRLSLSVLPTMPSWTDFVTSMYE